MGVYDLHYVSYNVEILDFLHDSNVRISVVFQVHVHVIQISGLSWSLYM